MINLKNRREESLYPTVPGATAVLTPTTTATLAPRWVAPRAGKIKAMVLKITNLGVVGGADTKDTLKLQKRGITGAVGAVAVTADQPLLDATQTPDLVYAAGTKVVIPGLAGNSVVEGEVLEPVWTETGTAAGTRPNFSILAVIFESTSHVDPSIA